MGKCRRVYLYGKSIILSTVAASLKCFANLEIIQLSPPLPEAPELASLAPDVIIFDVQASHPDPAFSLLRTLHNLMLIGIDPDSERVTLWTGQQISVLSTQELVQLISVSASNSISSNEVKE